jgi:Tol biopolymer transport system component
VNGANFVASSTVEWNGNSRTTTFVSSTQLQAHILAADVASPGKVNVTVVNPATGGGTSNAATFTVVANTIAFESTRALDGSNAGDTNVVDNIWTINPDGSGALPLTKLAFGKVVGNHVPVWSPDGSRIAFASGRAFDGSDTPNTNNTLNLWAMNADGSAAGALTKLTAIDAFSRNPAWSPDGRKIACESGRALDGSDSFNLSANIWVMNSDGSGGAPLTKISVNGGDSIEPVWSPDGTKVLFASQRALDGSNAANTNSVQNVWTVRSDGSGATPLTKLTMAFSGRPAWSPDSSKIAFESDRAFDGSDARDVGSVLNIWVVNADGSGAAALTKLTTSSAGSFEPVWSPDGCRILFASARALDGSDSVNTNFTQNIWVINADGSNPRPLTRITVAVGSSFGARWTPDGSKVVFTSLRALDGSDNANANATENIWIMNADGSGAVPLTQITAPNADSFAPNQP